jgi:hypothetical protein
MTRVYTHTAQPGAAVRDFVGAVLSTAVLVLSVVVGFSIFAQV